MRYRKKRKRNTEIDKKKKWRKDGKEEGENSRKRWTKRWKEKVNKNDSDEREKKENVERKNETTRDLTKTKKRSVLSDFLWFLKRREKRLKTIISKIMEKQNGFFPRKCFLNQEIRNGKESFSNVFPRKQQHSIILDT